MESPFVGDSAMAARMRAVDWASTPLGPVQGWPENLRTATGLMLRSRFPMFLTWGPELVHLYNDAYAPIIGAKHPAALGARFDDVVPEARSALGPLVERVLRGESTCDEDLLLVAVRSGFEEETYFSFSCSPFGDVGELGMFCAVTETTARVLGDRRLRALRELGDHPTGAAASVEDACEAAVRVLDQHRADVPFAAVYLLAEDGAPVRLVASSGLRPGSPLPAVTLPGPAGGGETIREVARTGRPAVATGVTSRHPGAVLPGANPIGDAPPDTAVVLPLAAGAGKRPAGVLVAGVSPYLVLDEGYRSFLDLVGQQVSKAMTDACAYEAQRRRAEELAELDRAKDTLFSDVSHEFRTPLALMMGSVEQLRADAGPGDPALRAELDVVHRNGLRLGRLVDMLLDLARIQAGRADTCHQPVDLAALTADLAGVFRSTIESAGLSLTVDCADLGEPVHLDPEMWEKVVLNLLSNAVKFTFDGGITVTLRKEPGAAVLRVADTGTGIPTSEMPRLFERFHRIQGAKARSAEGSGIGLAHVQELLGVRRGSITAESTVDVGTTFTVTVPLGREHLAGKEMRPAEPVVAGSPSVAAEPFVAEALRWLPDAVPPAPVPAEAAGRVLVVDDDRDMREYLVRLLSDRYQVEAVGDGQAALDAVRADSPDLLLCDVMMPGLDGIELVRALRAEPALSPLPVVLLSARAGEQAAAEGLAAGADDHLPRPFAARDLLARVESHLQRGRARRDVERRFREMADAAPALIWVDGRDGQRVFVNQAWTEFTGTDGPGAELARRWRERIHPADRQRYSEVRERAVESGEAFEVSYRLRNGDGQHRWMLDRGAPLGPPEQPEGYVGSCMDVDARYRVRERQRLLALIGGAMDREIGVQARREVFVRALVDEGVVDLARLIDIGEDGRVTVRAVAGRTPEAEELLAEVDHSWPLARDVVARDEPLTARVDEDYILASSADPRQRDLRRRLHMHDIALVPLAARGRVAGLLSTGRIVGPDPQDDLDLPLLVEIGQRAATALDTALLLEREQESGRRLVLLQQATSALSVAATPLDVAQTAVAQFDRLLGTPSVAVWELRETGILEKLDFGGWAPVAQRDWVSLPVDASSPAGNAARLREPIWVERVDDWEREYPRLLPMVRGYGYTSIDCLPMLAGGLCVGVVALGFVEERILTASERTAALALADQSAQALQRAGLLAAESNARRAAEELSEMVAALSGATTPAEVAEVMLADAHGLGAESAVVVLRDVEDLSVLAVSGPAAADVRATDGRLPIEAAHPLAHTVRTGKPVWVGSRSRWAWQDGELSVEDVALPAQVTVPLVLDNTTLGAIGLHFGDEVPVFTADERATILTLARQCAQALDRARLHERERDVADTLQRSLLPRELPALARLTASARYLPGVEGTQAGGDWYDLFPIDDERVALVVGDVVGHGSAAAAVMGQLRSALAGYLLEGHSPATALEHLDRFARRTPGATGSTCACLLLDCGSGEICWAGAGHLPVLLLEPDGPRYLSGAEGTVLGVTGRPPFREASTVIDAGTSVLLYTDGLVERRDEVVDSGLARLAAAGAAVRDRAPEALAAALLDRILDEEAPADDVALVVVRLIPPPLHERLPAEPRTLPPLRRSVERWATLAGLPGEMLEDLQFALGEAAANAVEHAYPEGGGEYEYAIARTAGGWIEARVRDWGTWRPIPAESGHRGHGLRVIHTIGEAVVIDTSGPGTEVGFLLPPAAGPTPPPSRTAASREQSGNGVSGSGAPGRAGAPATVTVTGEPAHRVVVFGGDLDLEGATALRRTVLAELGGAGGPVLDLRGAGYVSSAGVGLLVETGAAAATRPSVLVAPGSPAARILRLTGLDTVLTVTEDRPEAGTSAS